MGIPNFFPWLIKRYPLCLYDLNENTKHETDFLFLDLNQIIYKCSSEPSILFKDQAIGKEIQEIFIDVITYINQIIDVIEPQQVLYMALDGVSPIAKQNSQRQRRALSTRNILKINEKLSELGFKGNINNNGGTISPGTDFMEELNEELKYFIKRKFFEDPKWQNLKVIFSGSDVPGEGEHKILEFIRELKIKPNFNQSWTFTIYGSDADLILLALTTRLMNILIIREKQPPYQAEKYSIAAQRKSHIVEIQILNIGIVRDYFDLEYREIQNKMKIQYDVERIIDDFILLLTLIGNDFLPRIYSLDIKGQSFEMLVSMFKKNLLVALDYINDKGKINWVELFKLTEKLRQIEKLSHVNRMNEIQALLFKQESNNIEELKIELEGLQLLFTSEDIQQKQKFYLNILKTDINGNPELINQMAYSYLSGVQFVMEYYFNGLPSWDWQYPFYYASLIIDLFNFLEKKCESLSINFEKGEPQPVLKQLLSILTPPIANLLPLQYSLLLTDPNSPLRQPIDYYPSEFDVDKFGAKWESQSIVKYPFLDPQLQEEVFNSVDQKSLENKYQKRCKQGKVLIYQYNQNNIINVKSNNIFKEFTLNLDEIECESQFIIPIIEDQIKAEYSSISKIPFLPKNDIDQASLESRLTYNSTRDLLNLKFKNENKQELLETIQTKGFWVICGLIQQEFGYAIGVMKSTSFTVCSHKVGQELIQHFKLTGNSAKDFKSVNQTIKKDLVFQGIECSSQVIVFVVMFKKITRQSDGCLQTIDPIYKAYNLEQVFVERKWDSRSLKEKYQLNSPINHNKTFEPGSIHLMFTPDNTLNGAKIKVTNYDQNKKEILGETINYVKSYVFQKIQHHFNIFYTIQFTVEKLQTNTETLLGILGTQKIQLNPSLIQVDGIDIGLNLIDIFGNQIVPEYVRIRDVDSQQYYQPQKFQQNLELSEKCVEVLCEFKFKFPEIFEYFKARVNQQNYLQNKQQAKQDENNSPLKVADIYANETYGVKRIMQIFLWNLQLPFNRLNYRSPSSLVLSTNEIKDLTKFTEQNQPIQQKEVTVNPGFVIEKPSKSYYVPPFFLAQPEIHTINSRVINLNSISSTKASFGSTGTVIGIIQTNEIYVEVLWDEPQIGLTSLGGRCPPMRGSICKFDDVFNLSLGWSQKLCCYQKKTPGWDYKNPSFTPIYRGKAVQNESQFQSIITQIKSIKNPFNYTINKEQKQTQNISD